jgi:lipopolysaccharide biosynthesis regulator YciM
LDPITLVFILLPVAAASGWWMARRGENKPRPKKAGGLGREYIRGLDFLINDQTDKALEVFTRLVEVDQDTIETHLSLGALFRRRGEVDRALRVHQNLIARPNLPRPVHQRALLELARDYLAAGVLDRAEELFRELVEQNAYVVESLRRLIRIYEQQSDWEQAIEANRRLESVSSKHRGQQLHAIAHYHCELAEQKQRAGDSRGAKTSLKKSLHVYSDCARAAIALGDLAYNAGDYREANKYWQRVPEQMLELTPEVLPRLQQSFDSLNQAAAFYQWLAQQVGRYEGVAPYILLAEQAFRSGDKGAAEDWVQRYLEQAPDISGMGRLFSAVVSPATGATENGVRAKLQLALEDALGRMPAYRCNHCGFEARQLHWQCPSCHQWDTTLPLPHGPAGSHSH